uniref:Uncharacterized protein n=1 Tax=Oryza brachyantha TaxID=4533 RepID=J3MGA9_ORYBR
MEARGRRIVDYLNDGEELGIEGAAAVTPRSPALAAARSLLPRFGWARVASRIGRKGAGGKGKGKEVVVVEEVAVVETAAVASTSARAREGHTTATATTPDLGVGMSLVFLLAKTSDEFNKMAKVRAEMETLLREIKDQVRRSSEAGGGGDGDASKTHRNLESAAASSCLTDTNENERASGGHVEDHATSSNMEEEASCEKSAEHERFPRMDVLEEEFHTELELLQVNYGSDVRLFLPEEDDGEPMDEIAECRPEEELDDGDAGGEDEAAAEDDEDYEAEYNGVSAVELERRLHELLHQRNQERIEELELALKRAEKKLVEKEMEASMWKDTAKLALRQDSSMSW